MKQELENNTLYIAIGSLNSYRELLNKKENKWISNQAFVSVVEMIERYAVEDQKTDYLEEAVDKIVVSRMNEGLTTIYHFGEAVKDSKVLELIGLCKRNKMRYKILTFDTEYQKKYFVRARVDIETVFIPTVKKLIESEIDVIGDVHGCFREMILLIKSLGYYMTKGYPVHPKGRKLVWLGDLVDRGPKSIQTLQFVKNAVEKGSHYCIRGNHEEYLLNSFESYKREEAIPSGEGVRRTFIEFLREFDEVERETYVEFIRSLPHYLIKEYKGGAKFVLTHGNLKSFNPFSTLKTNCTFGSDDNLDLEYEEGFKSGENEYVLIRGHIEQTQSREGVFSLEDNQSFGGNLMSLPLEVFQRDASIEGFKREVKRQKVSFNYISFKNQETLLKRIKREFAAGYIKKEFNKTKTLQSVSYDKKGESSSGWRHIDFNRTIKSLILDTKGDIVQKSFDEISLYSPEDADSLSCSCIDVDIVNDVKGEIFNVSKHPFEDGLLIADENSRILDADQSIEKEAKEKITKFLEEGIKNLTLIFRSPTEDGCSSHISSSSYLIGARHNALHSKMFNEEKLDSIAREINVLRPKVEYNIQFQEALSNVRNSSDQEFIFRDNSTKKYLARISS